MKTLSAFAFLIGIGCFIDAATSTAFYDLSKHGGSWLFIDIVVGFAFWLVSYLLWQVAIREAW